MTEGWILACVVLWSCTRHIEIGDGVDAETPLAIDASTRVDCECARPCDDSRACVGLGNDTCDFEDGHCEVDAPSACSSAMGCELGMDCVVSLDRAQTCPPPR